MRRLMKYLFRLAVLVAIGFVAWAMLAELPAPVGEKAVVLPLPAGTGQ